MARGHQRIALVGEGDLAEIASLVAHTNAVEIAGIVVAAASGDVLKERLAVIGRVDAVLVTALVDSRSAYEAAIAAIGADRVYAPELLRLRGKPRKPEAA